MKRADPDPSPMTTLQKKNPTGKAAIFIPVSPVRRYGNVNAVQRRGRPCSRSFFSSSGHDDAFLFDGRRSNKKELQYGAADFGRVLSRQTMR
ncbi:hypothetical protein TNIN_181221 [Trichonephila inaurata madagascariensis]|uniref:Uncharacterized protein n=1 Tax=Trichonephila inaurata madagascariensis TaxID=2747483 RepID=A0A8X7C7T9_9ARAC|nr:hypothetical protein TNIN_181221 [Trichonephila inaurata madagascariensis]